MKYEDRVVAFIDILGFRDLLETTLDKSGCDNEEAIDTVISAYNVIRNIWDMDNAPTIFDMGVSDSRQVSIFSDCIVITFKVTEESEVFYTLLSIKWLVMQLLQKSILCRGAVSVGKVIHNDRYLFGPALVEAYLLESKAAIYPRIILDRNVIDVSRQNKSAQHSESEEAKYVKSLLQRDSDGMYFIDYFYAAKSELDDPEYDFPSYIETLGAIIRRGLMASSHHSKADIRVKYCWMRERYNKMIETVTGIDWIEELKLSGDPELAEFYENLKKISPNRYKNTYTM